MEHRFIWRGLRLAQPRNRLPFPRISAMCAHDQLNNPLEHDSVNLWVSAAILIDCRDGVAARIGRGSRSLQLVAANSFEL